jgi:pantoate--beta-alanine ligase
MGALHQGHLSLIQQSKSTHRYTVCSIYVNPTQFTDSNDLLTYPKPLEHDMHLLAAAGCDYLFLPTYEDIYPTRDILDRTYDLAGLDQLWEGAVRPGHFRGVCLVVQRLLEIVPCQTLFLGQKDFQQWRILSFMANHLLHLPIQVVRCPIVREADGLAMSSRNIRLSEQERKDSLVLFQALQRVASSYPNSSLPKALEEAHRLLTSVATLQEVDYLTVVDSLNLQPVTEWTTDRELVILVAARFLHARLIDNWVLPNG